MVVLLSVYYFGGLSQRREGRKAVGIGQLWIIQ